jgi:hypothetical protein
MYYLASKGHESSSERRRRRLDNGPGESVIRNILNYSKALSVFSTPETGIINLVMN